MRTLVGLGATVRSWQWCSWQWCSWQWCSWQWCSWQWCSWQWRSWKVPAGALLASALIACGDEEPSGPREAPVFVFTDWIRIDASCGPYTFRAPPDTVAQSAAGIDSCVERWTTSSCEYSSDYGGFSSDLREYREAEQYEGYEELQEVIDGQEVRLVTVRGEELFVAGVHFPRIAGEMAGIRLTVEARCQDSAGQLDALSVFRTISFSR
jgi:hypothetical protein